MSYQEKQAIVAIISNLIGSAVYFFYRFQGIDLNAALDLPFWSSTILFYMLVIIIFRIIIVVIFVILNTIITRKDESDITDEMDKLIEMKSTINFYHLFTLGVFLSIGTLLLNWPITALFIGILATMFIAGLFMEMSSFYFYRKGVY